MLAKLILLASLIVLLALIMLASEQRRILYPGAGSSEDVWRQPPAGYDQVQLRTSDGLRLRAWYRPASNGRLTLLFFHGNGDSVAGSARVVAPLVRAGYGALLAEYRGYAGNPGRPDEQGLYRDGAAARAFLRSVRVGDSELLIAGHSLGTGVAGKLAADRAPAAVILISAFASTRDVAARHFGSIPAAMVLDRYPTKDRIARIRAPVLLIHGADDRTVFPESGIALKKTAPAASLVIVPGHGHEIAYDPAAGRIMLEWLHKRGL
jgi:fermentation-respiration switch protein FrsA (DUF1100 family)